MSRRARTPAPEPVALDETFAATLVPARDVGGHKGTFGTLLAVCGSLDFVGAALLAGAAALRAGAGLVSLCVPASLQPVVAGRVPELITVGLPERSPFEVHPERAVEVLLARPHSALLVGPGLRAGKESDELVTRLLDRPSDDPDVPAVVDAEALNALARTGGWWKSVRRRCVLTPHPGEFKRLTGRPVGAADDERHRRATDAARRWGQVVVLKGARTVVAAPDGAVARAGFENPALATGGTGDILAGTIGSLLAQGAGPWQAACLGVFLQGTAAEHIRERLGDAGLLASDLLVELPRVRRHLVQLRDRRGRASQLGFMPRAAATVGD
jgi:NAD(P)H-hydrate epimerase